MQHAARRARLPFAPRAPRAHRRARRVRRAGAAHGAHGARGRSRGALAPALRDAGAHTAGRRRPPRPRPRWRPRWPRDSGGWFGPFEHVIRGQRARTGHCGGCGGGRVALGPEANGDVRPGSALSARGTSPATFASARCASSGTERPTSGSRVRSAAPRSGGSAPTATTLMSVAAAARGRPRPCSAVTAKAHSVTTAPSNTSRAASASGWYAAPWLRASSAIERRSRSSSRSRPPTGARPLAGRPTALSVAGAPRRRESAPTFPRRRAHPRNPGRVVAMHVRLSGSDGSRAAAVRSARARRRRSPVGPASNGWRSRLARRRWRGLRRSRGSRRGCGSPPPSGRRTLDRPR
jgi:hypothetical protein